jgi:hypothetical protein
VFDAAHDNSFHFLMAKWRDTFMSCNNLIRSSILRSVCGTLGLFALMTNAASAAPITGATATASTTFLGSANAAVNGAGLLGGNLHDDVVGNMWLSTTVNSGGGDPNPFLLIDLHGVYNITDFDFWQYNLNGAHGKTVKDVDITYSTSNPAGTGNVLGSFVFPQNLNPGGALPGTNYPAVFTARYILLDINSSWDLDNGDSNVGYGISEITFNGTAVPEPSSMVLMAVGGLFFGWRRWNCLAA